MAGASVDVGDQLDLTGVQFMLDPALDIAEPLEHGGSGIRLPPGQRIDHEQLLFNPDRERIAEAEPVLDLKRISS